MGTKENPGNYDCYAKAAPDEPIFTLRGKDPIAPYLVRIWTFTRAGDFVAAIGLLTEAAKDNEVIARISANPYDKLTEALQCASAMEHWRQAGGGTVPSICSSTSSQAHCRLLSGHEAACDFS
jgi:hypothetical protein